MKKILLLFITALLIIKSYAQVKDTVHLDEGYEKISLKEFNEKTKSNLYFIANVNTDSVFYKKLRFIEYYGILGFKKKHQLNKLFHQRFGIDSTKVWVIHYKDVLPDISKMPEKSGFILLDSKGSEVSGVLSPHKFRKTEVYRTQKTSMSKFVSSNKEFIKFLKQEKDYLSTSKNVELLHFYNLNEGYPLENAEFKWFKDYNNVLKNSFTDGMLMYEEIVLHPDGNFYTITHKDSLDSQKENANYNSFIESKNKWLKECYKYR